MSVFRSWLLVFSAATLHLLLIFTSLTSSAALTDVDLDVGNNLDVKYDEYPMVVPKRGAVVLDRILVALNRALMDKTDIIVGTSARRAGKLAKTVAEPLPVKDYKVSSDADNLLQSSQTHEVMGTQRRGQGHAVAMVTSSGSDGTFVPQRTRVWRCYFNAVTCFRKK